MTDDSRIPLGGGPYAVAVDPRGDIWTTLVHAGQVAQLRPGQPPVLHDLGNPASRPGQLAVGADGAVWVARSGDDRIDRLTADGHSHELPAGTGPYGIAAGTDGGIWFTAMGAGAVGHLSPDGAVDLTSVPGTPAMITAGPDGGLWVTLNDVGALARIDPAGGVALHELSERGCGPVGIAADDTAVWFAEILAGRVGRLVPGGEVREFDLPDRESRPHAVAPDGAGGCWVTLWASSAVVRLDEHGTVTAQHRFEAGDEPHGLAIGPDGSLLVALESGFLATVRGSR